MKLYSLFLHIFIFGFLFFSACDIDKRKVENKMTQYSESYRPLVHFSPPSGWMNDPNGMVYLDGEYHLFYQYYPDSTVWGPMHWGHAISKNLVQWENLPIALFPDSLGYIFSGSAVVDLNNTSGFGKEGKPAMVAIFTYHNMERERAGKTNNQSQGIAYSVDKGRSWTKYEKNPVLPNPGVQDFRDPKVSWNVETQKWLMTLAVGNHVKFYSSSNLKEWKFESEFGKDKGAHGGVWECPDLIEMTVDNSKGEKKWVLFVSINPGGPNGGSAAQYFTGTFDGHKFVNDNNKISWVDQGKDNYAGVSFSNIPESDSRIINIGWMSNWQYAQTVPTEKWRSTMTFPRQLTLAKKKNSYILKSEPVNEIDLLYGQKINLTPSLISSNKDFIYNLNPISTPFELKVEFIVSKDKNLDFGIEMNNTKGEKIILGYNRSSSRFYINRENSGKSDFSKEFKGVHFAPYVLNDSIVEMKLLVDVSSVEIFAMDGEVVMTDIFFLNEDFKNIRFFSNSDIKLNSGSVYKLNSIWAK